MHNYNPKLWGSSAWTFLMYIAMAYPDNPTNNDKEHMKLFLRSMGNVLPCEKCRVNFSHHQLKLPLNENVLNSRINLLNWMATVNNQVRINNNEAEMDIQDIIKKYISKDIAQTDHTYYPKNIYIFAYLCIIVLVLFIAIYVFTKSR